MTWMLLLTKDSENKKEQENPIPILVPKKKESYRVSWVVGHSILKWLS